MRAAPRLALGLTLALSLGGAGRVHANAGEAQVLPGDGRPVPVPSGQTVTLQDEIWNVPGPEGMTLRFRFVAPAIADRAVLDVDTAAADMQHLCDSYAVPRLPDFEPRPAQVVISLSAVPLAFGEAAPDVVQYFESYRVEDGACVWELF